MSADILHVAGPLWYWFAISQPCFFPSMTNLGGEKGFVFSIDPWITVLKSACCNINYWQIKMRPYASTHHLNPISIITLSQKNDIPDFSDCPISTSPEFNSHFLCITGIIHFSCHGVSTPHSPLESHLLLMNKEKDASERLTVEWIMQSGVPTSKLAYLSACSTASLPAGLPDEG